MTALDSCISYDRALIYHKNYLPGAHSDLRFDGFYKANNPTTNSVYPVFFYADGSVVFSGPYKDTADLRQASLLTFGYWGNYKINEDTIVIENFSPNGGTWNHDRNLQKGVISKDQIVFFSEVDRDNKSTPVQKSIGFVHFDAKPDPKQNWIRRKRKYNK